MSGSDPSCWFHGAIGKGAQKAEQIRVDAVVCEGYEAGGHNSPLEITTLALVPQVVDAVRIPVIAAGGISDDQGHCDSYGPGR
ncbi:MAG: nitronate monooxygenase [Desulfobacterales bacterium]